MSHFNSIKELFNTLAWSKDLLAEMFEKRKSFQFKYELAQELLEVDKIETLLHKGILRQNGSYLEIDDQYQSFFEHVLEVNEEINTSFINEHIQLVKQHINFYLQESNEHRRHEYLKKVKSALRKIGRITLRNIIDINRNLENAFKTEPNFAIKIARLEGLDEKRRNIYLLIEQTDLLVTEEDPLFFKTAQDEELKQVVTQLRFQLTEARHNLIETQKQVIEYLNQVKYQSRIIEKIKQVKYLKDQFELKAKTNFIEILQNSRAMMFESKPVYSLKLSLDFLQTDEGYQGVQKVFQRSKPGFRRQLPVADLIAGDYLQTEEEREIFINLEEIKNGFLASSHHLWGFVMNYRFPRPLHFDEKVTVFCQLISMYEQDFIISDNYNTEDLIEYALVYPG